MSVPDMVRREIKEMLWSEADRLDWPSLSASDKSRYYGIWTETKEVGGRLSLYMDPRQVRVYIKDTLLKPYTREASANHDLAFRVLGIGTDTQPVSTYIKPHGRLLDDDRQIAWSKASEWKATLMALHERAFERGIPYGAVLTHAGSKFSTDDDRRVVEVAASKLGIERIVWLG
ncbi:hypothetical protein [Sinorhizobium meliloti]|uniref:hypothetical protein n=1 Tax=Rhizobium meliloti TaxID=382 RepID=UPI000FD1A436|nr:hypothetical protein [Sinorhizobium meliloti]RVM09365.1 hypothetical protein CN125_14125 [Sinorhizobium meliloti]RVM50003.1 hypothetical protein CN121_07495 [Sinorhizobium meliloti]RVM66786.1 hypothetical protein CN124_13410 [Sinorhizobium meliloti]RVM72983.1 hypothetical protein CN123_02880 [Sinorhizobium meliloti]RVM87623.1 hypothetical protein CN117_05190 [Sinorhizobium meliloti]